MNLRKLCCGIGAILVWSCTPVTEPSSPEGALKGTESVQFVPIGSFSPLTVRDPLGRWAAQLEAESQPKLQDEAGFVHLTIPTANGTSLNCFVYDMVLDSGQAVVRFFRAASVGLTFRSFQVTHVDVVNEAPIVFFSGQYSPERTEERKGSLALMVSPRLQFPLVCSHDSPVVDPAFERIARSFSASFRVNEPASRPAILSEVWRVEDDAGPLGFWFYRAYRADDGSITNLSLSSLFRWGDDALETSDTVSVEVEDNAGLLRGRWLQMWGTEKRLEITLERNTVLADASSVEPSTVLNYRYLGEKRRTRVRGEIQPGKIMHSSFFLHQQLQALSQSRKVEPADARFEWSQYVPELNLDAPTPVELTAADENFVGLKRAGAALQIKLDETGLPQEISGESSSRLVLLKRAGSGLPMEPAPETDVVPSSVPR